MFVKDWRRERLESRSPIKREMVPLGDEMRNRLQQTCRERINKLGKLRGFKLWERGGRSVGGSEDWGQHQTKICHEHKLASEEKELLC